MDENIDFFLSYVNHLSDGTNERRSTLNPISIGFFFQSLIEIEVNEETLLPCQMKLFISRPANEERPH